MKRFMKYLMIYNVIITENINSKILFSLNNNFNSKCNVCHFKSIFWHSFQPLQSQEILNGPVFVLEILKKSEQSLNILNIFRKVWTDSEHYEYCLNILNRVWTESEHSWHCLKSLDRVWTFLTLSKESGQSLYILNIAWIISTESQHS